MNKVLIVQNITREMPGILAGVLEEENIDYDVVDLDKGEALPSPDEYAAVVVLGGPDSANDDTEKMHNELEWIRGVLAAELPYLGICLGLQTLVKAAGGSVVAGKVKEIGFIDPNGDQYMVELTDAGKTDPLLAGFADSLEVFQLHGETVAVTDDMTVLATGKHCENQIVRVRDRAYGIQSHFEVTPKMLEVWAANDPDLIPIGNDKLQADFQNIEEAYTKTGQTLLRNFLCIAGVI